MFKTTHRTTGFNGITKIFYDGELCATATANHKLRTLWISYNKGAGEPADIEELNYGFYDMPELVAEAMINTLQEAGAPTIYK